MVSIARSAFVLVLAILATGAGLLDAVAGQAWDLVAVFALLAALQLIVLTGLHTERRLIRLRPDLADWLRQQADATGEPVEVLADRCVAAYRAGLVGEVVAGDRASASPETAGKPT
jgi:hypothetical protein